MNIVEENSYTAVIGVGSREGDSHEKKDLTAILAGAMTFSMGMAAFAELEQDGAEVVNGAVQEENAEAADFGNTETVNTGSYDPQYPLAGMLDQLGLNFARDSAVADMLYWSKMYQNWTIGYDEGPEFIWKNVRKKTP